jgi:transposase-like protein
MFPLSRLYEILDELHRYQFQMANNTPPDSTDFKEYIDIIYRYSQNVKDFSDIIKLLHSYNNRHYSNYNPQVEGLHHHHEETY